MILENTGLNGQKTDLHHLDSASSKIGFVRWQWEYYRATYDYKIDDTASGAEYYLRISTRAVEGKLENPDAILRIDDVYLGRATFPHGLDYEGQVPEQVLKIAKMKLAALKDQLASH
ncbi:YugN family protein [Paenibacillus turpanensis]|uniref:YugN family protein n=1 Tax=Paenibacillus turpanensis TaxID=2689078 RepID=UPI001409889F